MKLKPCPFCGGEAKIYQYASAAYVECDYCSARIGSCVGRNSQRDASDKWNARHNEPPAVDEVPNLDSQKRENC